MPCVSGGNWGIGPDHTITEIDGHTFLHDRDVTPDGLVCCCGLMVAMRQQVQGFSTAPRKRTCPACGDEYEKAHGCDAWTRRRKIDALKAEVERLRGLLRKAILRFEDIDEAERFRAALDGGTYTPLAAPPTLEELHDAIDEKEQP
jgi:hypothetical protein